MSEQTVDITPTPRVLSILGDIPFATWQCIAELMDNSLDAFASARRKGIVLDSPQVAVSWSRENILPREREIVIRDNGVGMDLPTLRNAARAGFSNNDPIHNLGLFGMGFNIATAKLGDETLFLSATKDSSKWMGIKINFDDLQKAGSFQAPVISEPKETPDESGTIIIVRKLKNGIISDLNTRQASLLRKRLEKVYTPILSSRDVSITIQGKDLNPQPLCTWSETRFVVRKNRKISAIQKIDVDLGPMYFDEARNRYIAEDEYEALDLDIRREIRPRQRRLTGWIGIQRFSDPSDFGIDFIRNGRKILVGDKSLFQFENPETGMPTIEYPIELGTTTGGRIVGELNVDYLIPTYQKNGFDTTDSSWALTRDAIRGAGPLLPKNREILGYSGSNDSPLGLLVAGYRRLDRGTKNLSIDNALAKEYYREFQKATPGFLTDEKWYKAAQESDRLEGTPTTPVNTGTNLSDDPDAYGPETVLPEGGKPTSNATTNEPTTSAPKTPPANVTSSRNELLAHSVKIESLSNKYTFDQRHGAFNVTAYEVTGAHIKENGARRPCMMIQDGVDIDFFFDSTHPILAEYPLTAKHILLMELAQRFAARDSGLSTMNVYFGLVDTFMSDERINVEVLRNRATSILQTIKDAMPEIVKHHVSEAKAVLHAEPMEEETCLNKLLASASHLVTHYNNADEEGAKVFAFISDASIARFVDHFPALFLDGHVFAQPYMSVIVADNDSMTERLRRSSVAIVTAYINDAASILTAGSSLNKHELIRYCKSLDLLEGLTQ